jgi:hypothetical protein
MKTNILYVLIAMFYFGCIQSTPKTEEKSNFVLKRDTSPVISPINKPTPNVETPSYHLIEEKFSFSHILYGKYIVIGAEPSANMFSGAYYEVKGLIGYALVCDIAKGKATKDIKAFLNKEFYCISNNDSVFQYKITNLKIILHGTPHFGEVQQANQDSTNVDKAIFNMMMKNGAAYIVGEIETDRTDLLWARSVGLKKHETTKEDSLTTVSKKEKKILANALSLPLYFFKATVFKTTKDVKYIWVSRSRSTSDCGNQPYLYQENMLCTLNKDGKVEFASARGQDELIKIIDVDADGKLIFIYRDYLSKSIYVIV